MSSIDQAIITQLTNIQKKTSKTLEELRAWIQKTGLEKHGQIRDHLKKELGLGHGDANTLAHIYLSPEKYLPKDFAATPTVTSSEETTAGDPLDEIYVGAKAHFRPLHEALMRAMTKWGTFEIAPKKGYVSLRRKKQFCMIGPATNTRFEVGINIKSLPANPRLEEQPPKSMCQYKVKLTTIDEVNAELFSWIEAAFNAAG